MVCNHLVGSRVNGVTARYLTLCLVNHAMHYNTINMGSGK